MAISSNKTSDLILPYAKYSLTDPSGNVTEHEVPWGSFYKYSWYDGGRKNEIFHVGGGNPNLSEAYYQYDFGSYVLTPRNDFLAWAHIWGAGGGSYNSGDDGTRAGGGGFTQALIKFVANKSYTLVVGEAGNYGGGRTRHGGGGSNSNHSNSGSGGGLSGIFMDSTHYGKSPWAHNPPVTQSQALAIAGGGGGAGHHNIGSHHGQAGAGGGWQGKYGHNNEPGGQNGGGHGSYYSASTHSNGEPLHGGHQSYQNTWTGAGGGGWFGGGGGGHSSNHYNGGAGGSGHHAHPLEVGLQPNNDKAQYILAANTEAGTGSWSTPWRYSGNFKSPLAYRSSNPSYGEDQYYAGRGGRGNTTPTTVSSALHGKIVLTLAPDILGDWSTRLNSQPVSTIWTADGEYY